MQIWSWKKTPKNLTKISLGMVLGFILEGFRTVLGLFWALLAGSWPFLGRFKSSFFFSIGPRWAPRCLLERFWEGFGRIWGGFGRV